MDVVDVVVLVVLIVLVDVVVVAAVDALVDALVGVVVVVAVLAVVVVMVDAQATAPHPVDRHAPAVPVVPAALAVVPVVAPVAVAGTVLQVAEMRVKTVVQPHALPIVIVHVALSASALAKAQQCQRFYKKQKGI